MDTGLSAQAVWQRWAEDLALELGTPVTWGPFGFRVHGVDTTSPEAVRAIAGKPC